MFGVLRDADAMKQVTFDPNVWLKSVRSYCLAGILISLATFSEFKVELQVRDLQSVAGRIRKHR